jgi:hypothetical protein
MNRKWQEFIQFQQVGIGNQGDVHDEYKLHGFGVVQVGHFHLKEVKWVVDE